MSLIISPCMKHIGQESGDELCEIFKFCSFLQSKSVNNVCKLLQLLGDFDPKPSTGASPLNPTWSFPSPFVGYSPQMKIPGVATPYGAPILYCSRYRIKHGSLHNFGLFMTTTSTCLRSRSNWKELKLSRN